MLNSGQLNLSNQRLGGIILGVGLIIFHLEGCGRHTVSGTYVGGDAVEGAAWLQLIQTAGNRIDGQLQVVAMGAGGTVAQRNVILTGAVDGNNVVLSGSIVGPPNLFSTPDVQTISLSGVLKGNQLLLTGGPTQSVLSSPNNPFGTAGQPGITTVLSRGDLKTFQTIVNSVYERADWLLRTGKIAR